MNQLPTKVQKQILTSPSGSATIVADAVRLPGGFRKRLTAAVASVLLVACGGGNGGESDAELATQPVFLPTVSTAESVPTTSAKTSSTAVVSVKPKITAPPIAFVPVGSVITDIKIENTGLAQSAVPFTFGQVFAVGHFLPTEGLVAKLADGTVHHLQTDIKATHADGSVRHAIISGVLPSLAAGQSQTVQLAKSDPSEQSTVTPQNLVAAGLSGSVDVTVNNVQYHAALAETLTSGTPIKWLSGPIATEWIVSGPLKTSTGAVHPHLSASFAVRWYPGLTKQARVEVVVENNKTFAPGAQNFTYDVNVELGGKVAYSQANLTHFHHARWRKIFWWDTARAPAVHLKHNTGYLIASKAVSNYDQSIVPSESVLAAFAKQLTPAISGPMTIGPLMPYMPTAGGRPDIGPLPSWSVMYLLSMDKRAKDAMLTIADGSGTWAIHYRDEGTGFPLRVDNEKNKRVTTHMNFNHTGPLPVPRCANNNFTLCKSPYGADTSHQPSIAYLPYLITGDYFYLEELQFWAAWNPLETDPNNSGYGLGLVRWQQLRAQAWSLRTLGHAAYITPDGHYLKDYFTKQLDSNLNFYHDTYVKGNPNQLGAYDGSGPYAFTISQSAPWQDDFLTWSFGFLAELGFAKAQPILQWKAKYPVGRMTAPGYCWIEGAAYTLKIRESASLPKFTSFAEVYAANYKNETMANDDGKAMIHPAGLKYLDQPCGSQAQADWRTAAGGGQWMNGQMTGYATSAIGYPANMQPALAVAATSGIPDAARAWSTFANRAAKPDYSKAPQWAIIPR
jgi:hypothetical protein